MSAVEIAREVLDLAHEDDTITAYTIPDHKAAALARAVLRFEGLAREFHSDAQIIREISTAYREPYDLEGTAHVLTVAADRIRTALNGDNE